MKFSTKFKVQTDCTSEANVIKIDDVFKVLHTGGDTVTIYNLRRTLNKFQGGKRTYLGDDCANVPAVLKYLLVNSSKPVCQNIIQGIEKELIHDKQISKTIWDLYCLIAKTQIFRDSSVFHSTEFNEFSSISTLNTDYKDDFSDIEWKRICWFEKDISNIVNQKYHEYSYEDIVNLKYQRFQSLLSLKECCKLWNTSSKYQIRKNSLRYESSETNDDVRIVAGQVHSASVIDSELRCIVEVYCPNSVGHVTSFDVSNSKEKNCVWAVIVNKCNLETDFSDVCSHSFYELKRQHCVYLETVYLIAENDIANFSKIDRKLQRFLLRDVVETRQYDDKAIIWQANDRIDGSVELDEENEKCQSCFTPSLTKPLTLDNFNILHEWYFELPSETQILLEPFINEKSFKIAQQNDHEQEFYKKKLEKLYIVYDILLNIHNRNYAGLFQKSNTNKLLLQYKSVGSVFDVTSGAGATTSLNHAEVKLKKDADLDMCYYNTYLKEHFLLYPTINGGTRSRTNLRSCHMILMLDNLVRLQYVADPNPGEHRSKQLCTLPITIQGLPVDSHVTEEWHSADCDGIVSCTCKQPVTVEDGIVCKTLVELTDPEDDAFRKFFNYMTFGCHAIWKRLPDDLLEYVEELAKDDVATPQSFDAVPHQNQERDTFEADSGDEADEDLETILESIEYEDDTNVDPVIYSSDGESGDLLGLSALEKSMEEMSLVVDDSEVEVPSAQSNQECLKSFGFEKYIVPPLLCRHPPPATGRDDDIWKIKEILDDVLLKAGYSADHSKNSNRILCGPDNKIGKCVLQLQKSDVRYQVFLLEFPLLHLRKSKINILFSAYKEAGIVQLVKFMRGDENDDWAKLISIQHIDMATKQVKRISLSLHLAFLITFTQYLDLDARLELLSDLETDDSAITSAKWSKRFGEFLTYGSERNATFSLHVDMMNRCDDVVSIAFSERLGGETGYNLLLAAVKRSLLFSFVNGATSYAPFCARLLYSHYTSGHFHQRMKKALYTTPFKNSTRNFACDTKREIDHIAVAKGFRAGSSIDSVTCRMSLIDSLQAAEEKGNNGPHDENDNLGMTLSDVDMNHVYPTASLILRRGGLSLEESTTSCNVYTKVTLLLPPSILDSASDEVGRYLLERFLFNDKLTSVDHSKSDKYEHFNSPKELVSRAKRSKGVTIKRTQKSKVVSHKTERQEKEERRQKTVEKEKQIIDALSSDNNVCQALLKPDSSKPKVAKALGIQRALFKLISSCTSPTLLQHYMGLNLPYVPKQILNSMTLCTVEFAGMKFKVGNIKSGQDYISLVENQLNGFLKNSKASTIVVCEEKYSFTPDDFKSNTREQRKVKAKKDILHLKTDEHILSEKAYDKDVLSKTDHGKRLISTYLSKHIDLLKFNRNIRLIVDSEHVLRKDCACELKCDCNREYSVPSVCNFVRDTNVTVTEMSDVKQRKGEAEMAVADWLVNTDMKDGEVAVCYVTSADIDAVYIHLYAVSRHMKRNEDGTFRNGVYVVLCKPGGKVDVYNIAGILSLLESRFNDRDIGIKIAFALCLGGNDYIPKLYAISHDTILSSFLECERLRNNLFQVSEGKWFMNKMLFVEMVKQLFTPKRLKHSNVSFDEVRAITIAKKEDPTHKGGFKTSNPKKWLPPQSVIERLHVLVQLQIDYFHLIGEHGSILPDFTKHGVLRKNTSGEVEFDFGPEAQFLSFGDLPEVIRKKQKRSLEYTPQRGARRKRPMTSTPKSK